MNKKIVLVLVLALIILIFCITFASKDNHVSDTEMSDEFFESLEKKNIEQSEDSLLDEFDDNPVEVIDPITKKHVDVTTGKEI